jgi:hypothetical protein
MRLKEDIIMSSTDLHTLDRTDLDQGPTAPIAGRMSPEMISEAPSTSAFPEHTLESYKAAISQSTSTSAAPEHTLDAYEAAIETVDAAIDPYSNFNFRVEFGDGDVAREASAPTEYSSSTYEDINVFDTTTTRSTDFLGGGGATRSSETINGTLDDDLIYGGDGSQSIHAYWGNDTVYAGDGNDFVNGGDGSDDIYGEQGNDVLWAGGGSVNDVYGGSGHDEIRMGGGGDVDAGSGNDFIDMGSARVLAEGGTGADQFHWGGEIGERDIIKDFELGVDTFSFDKGFFLTGPGDTLNDVMFAHQEGDNVMITVHSRDYGEENLVRLWNLDVNDVQARIDNGTILSVETNFDGADDLFF